MQSVIQLDKYSIPALRLPLMPPANKYENEDRKAKSAETLTEEEMSKRRQLLEQLQTFLRSHYEEDCVILMDAEAPALSAEEELAVLAGVIESIDYDAKMLAGNACWIDQVLPLTDKLLWVDHFTHTAFVVLYKSLYDDILNTEIPASESFPVYLSYLSSQKLLLYPFVFRSDNVHAAGYGSVCDKIDLMYRVSARYGKRLANPEIKC